MPDDRNPSVSEGFSKVSDICRWVKSVGGEADAEFVSFWDGRGFQTLILLSIVSHFGPKRSDTITYIEDEGLVPLISVSFFLVPSINKWCPSDKIRMSLR